MKGGVPPILGTANTPTRAPTRSTRSPHQSTPPEYQSEPEPETQILAVHKKELLTRPGAEVGVPPILGRASTPTPQHPHQSTGIRPEHPHQHQRAPPPEQTSTPARAPPPQHTEPKGSPPSLSFSMKDQPGLAEHPHQSTPTRTHPPEHIRQSTPTRAPPPVHPHQSTPRDCLKGRPPSSCSARDQPTDCKP